MSHALLEAVRANDVPATDTLLTRDPSLADARDEQGTSAVLTAVYYGAHDAARLLIARGARLDIHEAAAVGDARRVEILLSDDPHLLNSLSHDGWRPLHLAAFFGHRDVAELLLDEGAEIHAVSTNRMENMPLHAAAANGRTELVELLLDRGADVNAQARGWSPLHLAVGNQSGDLVRLLLARGADADATMGDGQTPFARARQEGNAEIAELLADGARSP